MAKTKPHPWDPADQIVDGEDAIMFLKISLEDYDSMDFDALMECIARSRGVAEITTCAFNSQDGVGSVTVTTTSGASATLTIAPEVDVDSIRRALISNRAPETIAS